MLRRGVVVAGAGIVAAVLLVRRRRRRELAMLGPAGAAPPLASREHGRTLVLFDVDGTLAVPAQPAESEMVAALAALRERYAIGIVGAGDFEKQQGQLGGAGLRGRLDFVFSENGVHAFRGARMLHCKSLADQLGAARWSEFQARLDGILASCRAEAQQLLTRALAEGGGADAAAAAELGARGTFLEKRTCTVNVCVIGRTPALSKGARAAFDRVDREAGLRARVLARLVHEFGPATPFRLTFSIGGQIGIDCAPCGWDKTFCLQFVDAAEFDTIHFFGDKTAPGGGDHELYEHPRTVGHTVTSPEDTIAQLKRLFLE